jgi:hypothetical protein
MLRHQIAELLHRLDPRLLNFLRWAIKDSIGQITVLGISVFASFIIQTNNIEFDYGLQIIVHLLTIGGPFLMFILCLASREPWTKPYSTTLPAFVILIILLTPFFFQVAIITFLASIIIALVLLLIFWLKQGLRNNTLLRAIYILCSTFLSIGLIASIAIAMRFGYFPATLINRTYKDNQVVVSVYEAQDINIIATADTLSDDICRYQIEQKQIFPGILIKVGSLKKECHKEELDYSIEFRSKP